MLERLPKERELGRIASGKNDQAENSDQYFGDTILISGSQDSRLVLMRK
jgi:hypothetical protein